MLGVRIARTAPVVALAVGTALLGAGGCSRQRTVALRDTEGRTFLARCTRGSPCQVELTRGARLTPDTTFRIESGGWLAAVCEDGAELPNGSHCRPLECRRDDECPPYHRLATGHCLEGLCARPDHQLIVEDAVMLCLAGTGIGRATAAQVERHAMALQCGTPCVVPKPCRQPMPQAKKP